MLTLLLFVVFIACVAMMWNEGLWGNALTLLNVTVAGLIATNYFEPLAYFFEGNIPSYTYFCDFLALWALFVFVYGVLRTVTDLVARRKVRFRMPVEQGGRVFFALWAGWIMVGFTAMSLHLAPLPAAPFGGSFYPSNQPPGESTTFLGLAPDRQWLAFVQTVSRGSLARGYDKGSAGGRWKYDPHPNDERFNLLAFDSRSEWILKYRDRRRTLEKYNEANQAFRVDPNRSASP